MLIEIRLARRDDAAAVAAIYAPIVQQTPISFETVPPAEQEMGRRISQTLAAYPWLVCEVDGQIAGYAYATRHRDRAAYRWSVDTSVYVAGPHQRCGVGRGLYLSLLAILAAQGYVNVYAGITLPNPASVALHESVGFERLGVYRGVGHKFDAWHDVGWWELALQPHDGSPDEPIDIATVQQRAEWDILLERGLPVVRSRPRNDRLRASFHLGMDIREFRSSDEQAVITVWEQCGLTRPWNDPRKDIARKQKVRPDLFLVGVADGRIVATVMAGYDGHRGWVSYLAVAPEERRRGLGRAIMRAAEQRLAAAGCPKVNLQIRSDNAAVVAFYRALGYVHEDRVSMGRRLDSDAEEAPDERH